MIPLTRRTPKPHRDPKPPGAHAVFLLPPHHIHTVSGSMRHRDRTLPWRTDFQRTDRARAVVLRSPGSSLRTPRTGRATSNERVIHFMHTLAHPPFLTHILPLLTHSDTPWADIYIGCHPHHTVSAAMHRSSTRGSSNSTASTFTIFLENSARLSPHSDNRLRKAFIAIPTNLEGRGHAQ